MRKSPKINKDMRISFCGETKTLREWARITGITIRSLHKRIVDLKWPLEKAFDKELRPRGHGPYDVVTYKAFGMEKTIGEWAQYSGIAPRTISNRIRRGEWSVEDAVTIKPGKQGSNSIMPMAFGRRQTYAAWAKEFGISYDKMWEKMKNRGWTLEETLNYYKKSKLRF